MFLQVNTNNTQKMKIFCTFEIKKEQLQKDIEDLENSIYPTYEKIVTNIPVQKNALTKHSETFINDLNNQEKIWHKELRAVMKILRSEIHKSEFTQRYDIERQEKEIDCKIREISKTILELKMLRDNNDVSLISAYKSRNEELRSTLPAMYQISLLTFTPYQIHIDQIGLLSKLDMLETEKHGTAIKSLGIKSNLSKISKMFIDEPQIIMDVKTDHVLSSVFCQNETDFWTCGEDKDMKLHNLKGELLTSLQSKSGNIPWDVTVTKEGDLIYSDRKDSSINIVKSEGIVELIKLQGWIPRGVYSTPSGDLLVSMNSEDNEQTKVVRYSGYTEKQNIQWDDEGRPLYTSSGLFNTKYVNENKNLDICVADNNAGAVVVVSAAGILRFRYKGPSFPTKGSFTPVGITTDSQSRILTSDINNDCIHILDQDGQFLRFIVNRKLSRPWDLCVDSKDNLFVAVNEGRVKKIKYYQ